MIHAEYDLSFGISVLAIAMLCVIHGTVKVIHGIIKVPHLLEVPCSITPLIMPQLDVP